MSYKDKLEHCLISLDVGGKNAIFIVLAKDGTICRRGNGNPDKEMEMLKGYSDDGHYEAFMMTVNEDWFVFSGAFEQAPMAGRECKLLLVFSGPNEEEAGFKCMYGEDSQGPPKEMTDMLINAVKITEGWYQSEREKLKVQPLIYGPSTPPVDDKKWWEFWR